MEGQDILSKVESIELEKKRKVAEKQEKTRQRRERCFTDAKLNVSVKESVEQSF